jgi:hypothetical protein
MNVLVVEPGKVPYESDVAPGLASLQRAVDGYVEAIYPFADPVAIVCNEEGKLLGLQPNRALTDENGEIYDIVVGKFLVVGLGTEDFTSLPDDLMAKYKEQFRHPETFCRLAGKIVAVKLPVHDPAKQASARSGHDHDAR